jgi:hypothetical protein
MKPQLSLFTLITGIAMVVLSSCAVDEGPFQEPSCEPDLTDVSFSVDVQAIFNSSCTACHSESHPKLNLLTCCSYTELTSTGFSAPYVNTGTPTNSLLYRHMVGELSVMPPSGPLPDFQINTILKWIEQGAKNN